jgi:hypothetical protein
MMDNMMPGMMWGMGLVWLLVVIVLILAAAARIKYLRTGARTVGNEQAQCPRSRPQRRAGTGGWFVGLFGGTQTRR